MSLNAPNTWRSEVANTNANMTSVDCNQKFTCIIYVQKVPYSAVLIEWN